MTIIGVGAIGRQLALQLAAMGVREFQLIDFDQVDGPMLPPKDSRRPTSVGRKWRPWRGRSSITIPPLEWRSSTIAGGFAKPCTRYSSPVSIQSPFARPSGEGVGRSRRFWGDARMLGEVIRILVAADEPSRSHYPTTLFEVSQAQQGSCTARSTIYSASIAAGLLAHQFARWLRGDSITPDLVSRAGRGRDDAASDYLHRLDLLMFTNQKPFAVATRGSCHL